MRKTKARGENGEKKKKKKKKKVSTKSTAGASKATEKALEGSNAGNPADVGLTVRIEVNLPAEGDQETYDRIFRSIRQNLIDRE